MKSARSRHAGRTSLYRIELANASGTSYEYNVYAPAVKPAIGMATSKAKKAGAGSVKVQKVQWKGLDTEHKPGAYMPGEEMQ